MVFSNNASTIKRGRGRPKKFGHKSGNGIISPDKNSFASYDDADFLSGLPLDETEYNVKSKDLMPNLRLPNKVNEDTNVHHVQNNSCDNKVSLQMAFDNLINIDKNSYNAVEFIENLKLITENTLIYINKYKDIIMNINRNGERKVRDNKDIGIKKESH